jgi:hypothetical protein
MWATLLSITDGILKLVNWILVRIGKEPIKHEKPVIYVVLPTNKEGRTMGDGLLQAAGFLAAGSLFGDEIEIQPFDHYNKESEAKTLLYKIIGLEKKKKGPICIIFTMSDICRAIAQEFKDEIQKHNKKIAKRLNIIFTVASIKDESLHDGKHLLHHFITCDKEIKRISLHRDSIIAHGEQTPKKSSLSMSESALLYLESGYPRAAVSLLKDEFGHSVVIREVLFDRKGEIRYGHRVKDVAEMTNTNKRFVIIVAYDVALKEALKTLKNIGYKGIVIATTTLSVKDWQEYLGKKEYLASEARFFYTYVKGFNVKSSKFAENLQEWNFETITDGVKDAAKYYKEKGTNLREAFLEYDKDAEEIYKNIHPNYISAFCFDSVRLFVQMHSLKVKSLYGKKMKDNAKWHAENYSPFENIEIFEHNGKTEVPLDIDELLT